MALKVQVDSLDEVPEPQRGLYVEDGGRYRLDVDGLPDVAGLNTALSSERRLVREMKAKLGRFQIDGKEIDAGAYQQAMGELEELRAKVGGSPEQKREDDARVRELTAKLDKLTERLNASEQERQQTKQRLRTSQIERDIDAICEELRVQDQYRGDARLRASMFTVLDDDKTVVLANQDGSPYEDEHNKPVPAREWFTRFVKEERPGWITPSSGGGARGTAAAAGVRGIISRDDSAGLLNNLEAVAKGKVAVQ